MDPPPTLRVFGQTHSFMQSTRGHSVRDWEETFIKGKKKKKTQSFWENHSLRSRVEGKTFKQAKQTPTQTSRKSCSIPPCFSFLSMPQRYLPASCATQSYLISCSLRHSHWGRCRSSAVCLCVCMCVLLSVLCVPQEVWGMNSLHRHAQLSLGVFTSKQLLHVSDKL